MPRQSGTTEKRGRFYPLFCVTVFGVVAIATLGMGVALIFYFDNPKSTRQYGLLLIVVAITVLSMGGALVVYSSSPESRHQKTLQSTLLEAFIRAWTMGVGAIFGLLWGMTGS